MTVMKVDTNFVYPSICIQWEELDSIAVSEN